MPEHPEREALGGCGGCTACCTKCGAPPFETMAEVMALPQPFRNELLDYYASVTATDENPNPMSRETAGLPCLWLNPVARHCTHYGLRPRICREFMVGGSQCVEFIQLGLGVPTEPPPWREDPRGGPR